MVDLNHLVSLLVLIIPVCVSDVLATFIRMSSDLSPAPVMDDLLAAGNYVAIFEEYPARVTSLVQSLNEAQDARRFRLVVELSTFLVTNSYRERDISVTITDLTNGLQDLMLDIASREQPADSSTDGPTPALDVNGTAVPSMQEYFLALIACAAISALLDAPDLDAVNSTRYQNLSSIWPILWKHKDALNFDGDLGKGLEESIQEYMCTLLLSYVREQTRL